MQSKAEGGSGTDDVPAKMFDPNDSCLPMNRRSNIFHLITCLLLVLQGKELVCLSSIMPMATDGQTNGINFLYYSSVCR